MNVTEINTDGVCVFVHIRVKTGKSVKILIRTAVVSIILGIIVISNSTSNSLISQLGFVFLLYGIIAIFPMFRTLLWNLYGEEIIVFSTKSIVRKLNYGIFNLNPKTYVYDQRLKFDIDILREEKGVKEGVLNFYGYDENNQPIHIFRTIAYMKEEDCKEIISKMQLIFALDKDLFTQYSAN